MVGSFRATGIKHEKIRKRINAVQFSFSSNNSIDRETVIVRPHGLVRGLGRGIPGPLESHLSYTARVAYLNLEEDEWTVQTVTPARCLLPNCLAANPSLDCTGSHFRPRVWTHITQGGIKLGP